MSYGEILKNLRIEQKLSQQELADRANVTRTIISYWETGKRKMTMESADKVFRALGKKIVLDDIEAKGHGQQIEESIKPKPAAGDEK